MNVQIKALKAARSVSSVPSADAKQPSADTKQPKVVVESNSQKQIQTPLPAGFFDGKAPAIAEPEVRQKAIPAAATTATAINAASAAVAAEKRSAAPPPVVDLGLGYGSSSEGSDAEEDSTSVVPRSAPTPFASRAIHGFEEHATKSPVASNRAAGTSPLTRRRRKRTAVPSAPPRRACRAPPPLPRRPPPRHAPPPPNGPPRIIR